MDDIALDQKETELEHVDNLNIPNLQHWHLELALTVYMCAKCCNFESPNFIAP